MRKISPPPRFDPRTVQPVASRCTDYAIPAHLFSMYFKILVSLYFVVFKLFIEMFSLALDCILGQNMKKGMNDKGDVCVSVHHI